MEAIFGKCIQDKQKIFFVCFSVCASVPFDVVKKELILHAATDHLGVNRSCGSIFNRLTFCRSPHTVCGFKVKYLGNLHIFIVVEKIH